ncbi:formylglycine-generating enzyme family protein [Niabella hibiscisoli]|uniref:formylglycine-generating enzyme family protein n=1 Tax=Niabella hibiscisoli TaxID=1825928 RepID=UPI0021D43092|nr:formylglycine-generating enzyme family protein [Niabella hibiscisoli]
MRHILLLTLIFCIFNLSAHSQMDAYREFRAQVSVPPYGLSKVKALIAKIKPQSDEDNSDMGISPISKKEYEALALREKFTYTMIHPEMYAQNCAIFVPQTNEDQKIFGYLISWMDEETWSERQLQFLVQNRDSVMAIIKESVTRSKRMGVNYKDALVEINAWEMTPFLISYYKENKKDKDVLTTLMLLMKKGNYADFIKSKSYKNLYGVADNYETSMAFNKANEELTLQRALAYFNSKKPMLKSIRPYALLLILWGIISPPQIALSQDSLFVHIPAGTYQVGEENNLQNPLRKVKITTFYIAAHELTNNEFDLFIQATGYITEAERHKNALVFEPGLAAFRWITDSTAYWRYPNGITRGSIAQK